MSVPKKRKRPVIRARLPLSLYRVPDGEAVYEFEIPGYGGYPPVSGLIHLRRNGDYRPEIAIARVDDDRLMVIGPLLDVDVTAINELQKEVTDMTEANETTEETTQEPAPVAETQTTEEQPAPASDVASGE